MYGYIYLITNLLNNKIYVGQHKTNDANSIGINYFGSGPILKEALSKYGKDNFKYEILDECDTFEEANLKERFWIALFDANHRDIGYNISLGGQGISGLFGELNPNYGKDFSSEHRQHLSESHVGIQAGENHPMYGKHHSQTTKDLISEKNSGKNHPNYGKHLPEETKLKISKANKENPSLGMLGKHHSITTKEQMSKATSIAVINLDTGEIFESAKIAAEKCGTYRSGICYCCNNTQKTAGGYHWKYYTIDIEIENLVDNSQKVRKCNKLNQIIDLDTGIIYSSVKEAELLTGIISSSIYKCCNGIRKTAGKHHWQIYKEDVNNKVIN